MRKKTVAKGIEFKGQRTLTDPDTGEVIECQAAVVRDCGDYNFQKFWLQNAMSAIDELSNKRMKVVMYLLGESMKRSNMIVKTVEEIARDVGCGTTVVQETITILYKHDILRRKGPGVRMFNPSVIWKGSGNRRQAIILEYIGAGRHDKLDPSRKDRDVVVLNGDDMDEGPY